MITTLLYLSGVVVLRRIRPTKSCIAKPIVRDAEISMNPSPVLGILLGPYGVVINAQTMKQQYPTILSMPIAISFSPK